MGVTRRTASRTSEHDRGRCRPDHCWTQHRGIPPRLWRPYRGGPDRPDDRRDDQAPGRADSDHEQRPAPLERAKANRGQQQPPPENTTEPLAPRARGPSRSLGHAPGGLPEFRPLVRVMDRCRRLAPEVVRSHRARYRVGRRGNIRDVSLRRTRPERHQLLARPEPVSWEVDDVRCRVVVLVNPVVGCVVFHRFCRPFSSGPRSTRPPGRVVYALELAPVRLN